MKSRTVLVTIIFVAFVLITLPFSRPAHAAGDPIEEAFRMHLGPGGIGMFGYSIASVGDLNHDGAGDYAIGSPGVSLFTGTVGIYSGLDGSSMHDFNGISLSFFGYSIAAAGDVDNDGTPDLIVGAPFEGLTFGGGAVYGAAYVYSGANWQQLYRVQGPVADCLFGHTVMSAGDINGDGHADFAVAMPYVDGPAGNECGVICIYSGMTGGVLHYIFGPTPGARFAVAMANLGDVTGDGSDDAIVGMPGADKAALVNLKSGNITLTFTNSLAESGFGWSVASAGDVNGDGLNDIIVGARYAADNSGRAYLYHGGTGQKLKTYAGHANSQLGAAVGSAGDFNHDGFDDVVIGSPYFGPTHRGRVEIYSGKDNLRLRAIVGAAPSEAFGFNVAPLGDINSDGFDDVLVGELQSADGSQAAVYIFTGDLNEFALDSPTDSPISFVSPYAELAQVLSVDVNKDGFPDVISRGKTRVFISLNDGEGGFKPAQSCTLPWSITGMAAHDINFDGLIDLAVTVYAGKIVFYRNTGSLFVFDSSITLNYKPLSIAMGLFSDDSKPDIAVTCAKDNKIRIYHGRPPTTFTLASRFVLKQKLSTGTNPVQVVAAKINLDGLTDLAVINKETKSLTVYLNQSTGLFVRQPRILLGAVPTNLVFGDFNKDGFNDLAMLCSGSSKITVRHGNGGGLFGPKLQFQSGAGVRNLFAVDLNRDKYKDLIAANYTANTISVLLNNQTGGFAPASTLAVGDHPAAICAADFDTDSDPDIIAVKRSNGKIVVLPNLFVK